jgi:hypothetical protein
LIELDLDIEQDLAWSMEDDLPEGMMKMVSQN